MRGSIIGPVFFVAGQVAGYYLPTPPWVVVLAFLAVFGIMSLIDAALSTSNARKP